MIIMNKQERMDKSIWETYRSIGDVLAEAGLMGAPKPGILRRNSVAAQDAAAAREKGHSARKGTEDARDAEGRKKKKAAMTKLAFDSAAAEDNLKQGK